MIYNGGENVLLEIILHLCTKVSYLKGEEMRQADILINNPTNSEVDQFHLNYNNPRTHRVRLFTYFILGERTYGMYWATYSPTRTQWNNLKIFTEIASS
ncbi:hypothetical protein NPIL_203611 [Nephila pilipes]|uniref:Uncharacterized protein n=1 Tax=Nephila pilipes TaxID=299642 RepID=A0A8X6QKP8_NEPPI|nr:hypothetical protein NPIL_203611 [Nephila pilipes]